MTLDGFLQAFREHARETTWRLIDHLWSVPGKQLVTMWGGFPDSEGMVQSPLTYVALQRGAPRVNLPTFMPIRLLRDVPGISTTLDHVFATRFLGISEGDAKVLLRACDGHWLHDRTLRMRLLAIAGCDVAQRFHVQHQEGRC